MRTLELANGSIYDCDWCGAVDGVLTANLVGQTDLLPVVAAFRNPESTKCMTFHAGEDQDQTFCGYTRLRMVQLNGWPTGGVLVSLEQDIYNDQNDGRN